MGVPSLRSGKMCAQRRLSKDMRGLIELGINGFILDLARVCDCCSCGSMLILYEEKKSKPWLGLFVCFFWGFMNIGDFRELKKGLPSYIIQYYVLWTMFDALYLFKNILFKHVFLKGRLTSRTNY